MLWLVKAEVECLHEKNFTLESVGKQIHGSII